MKQFFFLAILLVQMPIFSQSEAIIGTYQFTFDGSNGTFGERLVLHANGSFDFHSFKKLDGMDPPESVSYGKGTWDLKNNVVYFSTLETDFDKKFTLDLNNTQARFSSKSPRDTTNRNTLTTLTIFKSEIAWLIGRKLKKQ